MNFQIRIPFSLSLKKQGNRDQPLARIAGSLEGSAIWEDSSLDDLKSAVKEVSARRPFRYDLALSGGRFIVMLSENLVPLSAFQESPEATFSRDLQEICDAVPDSLKNTLSSTFRCLWRKDSEVSGVAFAALPSGTIVSETRTRPDSEYDRMVEEQDHNEFSRPTRQLLPRWASFSLAVAAVILFSLSWYLFGPDARYRALRKIVPETELGMLEPLMKVEVEKLGREGMVLVLEPKILLDTWIEIHEASPAVDALRRGALFMQIFDEEGVIMDTIPLNFKGYSGEAPVRVRSRAPELLETPAGVSIRF